jgi:hypothetical protein
MTKPMPRINADVVCRECGQEMAAEVLTTHYMLAHDQHFRGTNNNILRMSKPKVGMFSSQPARVSFESTDSGSSSCASSKNSSGSSEQSFTLTWK